MWWCVVRCVKYMWNIYTNHWEYESIIVIDMFADQIDTSWGTTCHCGLLPVECLLKRIDSELQNLIECRQMRCRRRSCCWCCRFLWCCRRRLRDVELACGIHGSVVSAKLYSIVLIIVRWYGNWEREQWKTRLSYGLFRSPKCAWKRHQRWFSSIYASSDATGVI